MLSAAVSAGILVQKHYDTFIVRCGKPLGSVPSLLNLMAKTPPDSVFNRYRGGHRSTEPKVSGSNPDGCTGFRKKQSTPLAVKSKWLVEKIQMADVLHKVKNFTLRYSDGEPRSLKDVRLHSVTPEYLAFTDKNGELVAVFSRPAECFADGHVAGEMASTTA